MKKSAVRSLTAARRFEKVERGMMSKGAGADVEDAEDDDEVGGGAESQPCVSARTKPIT